jgi:hypothetical protein
MGKLEFGRKNTENKTTKAVVAVLQDVASQVHVEDAPRQWQQIDTMDVLTSLAASREVDKISIKLPKSRPSVEEYAITRKLVSAFVETNESDHLTDVDGYLNERQVASEGVNKKPITRREFRKSIQGIGGVEKVNKETPAPKGFGQSIQKIRTVEAKVSVVERNTAGKLNFGVISVGNTREKGNPLIRLSLIDIKGKKKAS